MCKHIHAVLSIKITAATSVVYIHTCILPIYSSAEIDKEFDSLFDLSSVDIGDKAHQPNCLHF